VETHGTATLKRRLGRTGLSWFRQLVPCFGSPPVREDLDLNKERRNITHLQE